MRVGRGNIKSLDQNTDYSIINEIWVTQHPCCFQNISSTNLHQFYFVKQHEHNINNHNIEVLCMQLLMLNIFNLFEKFSDIINNKCSLIMCAKYCNSRRNDVHKIYLADIVSLPAKVVWPTAFFLQKKMIFIQLLCWPSAG